MGPRPRAKFSIPHIGIPQDNQTGYILNKVLHTTLISSIAQNQASKS